MTLFDLLHTSMEFNTGAEVRRAIMQGLVKDSFGDKVTDPQLQVTSGKMFFLQKGRETIFITVP